MPVPIPKGVEVQADGDLVRVKGPKGELANRIPAGLSVKIDGSQVLVGRSNDEKTQRALHGLLRSGFVADGRPSDHVIRPAEEVIVGLALESEHVRVNYFTS